MQNRREGTQTRDFTLGNTGNEKNPHSVASDFFQFQKVATLGYIFFLPAAASCRRRSANRSRSKKSAQSSSSRRRSKSRAWRCFSRSPRTLFWRRKTQSSACSCAPWPCAESSQYLRGPIVQMESTMGIKNRGRDNIFHKFS